MRIIKEPILFAGSKADKSLYILFDSGANLSCIHPDYAAELGMTERLGRVRKIATASEGHY